MKTKLSTLISICKDLLSKIILTKSDLELLFLLKKEKNGMEPGSRVCLVQMPHDFWFMMRTFLLLKVLNAAKIYGIQIYFPTSSPKKLISRVIKNIQDSEWVNYKWALFYRTFGIKVDIDFKNISRDQEKFDRLWRQTIHAKSRREFSKISLDQVRVGDLIYDTYIRFKPAPTLDFDDPFLKMLVEKSIDIYIECENFLSHHHVDTLITTYTCYIHHGILTRMCLQKGIEVNVLGALNQLIVQPSIEYPLHKRHAHKYKIWAESYPDQKEMLSLGKNLIDKRISGEIDAVTSYMKVSAYANQSEKIKLNPNKKSAVIMAHDFYDSPHGWGDMLFEDFYQWFEFLLPIASDTDFDFYIKPHPNAIHESAAIYDYFFKKYPKIKRIDPSVSNIAIAQSGFTCAFTLYGTIAHEFAYLGLPTISAGSNQHRAFDFTRVPSDLSEYEQWIRELKSWTPNKEDVLKFIFMHNYCVIKNKIPSLTSIHNSKEFLQKYDSQFKWLEEKMKFEYEQIQKKSNYY